ncbi:hypothetical protein AGMMS50243_28860 [Betaproteobacteria bacterium]|nr:hypothetical protein AGMMS50243_28860 [Betaproteobacteria bacterium]
MTSPYPSLAQKTAELKKLAEAGQWEIQSPCVTDVNYLEREDNCDAR